MYKRPSCSPSQSVHMATRESLLFSLIHNNISRYNFRLTCFLFYVHRTEGYFKRRYFGGATAFTKDQFENINGFSNSYYGWGLEDDDARERVLSKYPEISRPSPEVGRYFANCHEQQAKNPNRFILYLKSNSRAETDGLNSIDYQVASVEKNSIFTRFYISYKNND